MTVDEKEELKILKIFVIHKIERFSEMSFPEPINKALGSGAWVLVHKMMGKGYVADLHNQEYEFTRPGHDRYELLKKQKRSDLIGQWAFWIIFGCTIIAAADVVAKRLWPDRTPQTQATPEQSQPPVKESVTPTTLLDKGRLRQSDTLKTK